MRATTSRLQLRRPGPERPAQYKTYTNSYLSDGAYTSRYVRNRLLTSTMTDGTSTVTLATNSYDSAAGCTAQRISGGVWQPVQMGNTGNQWPAGTREHDDANCGDSFTIRGNVTGSTSPGHAGCRVYNAGGMMTFGSDNGVAVTSTSTTAQNMAAPSAMTTNTLPQSNLSWDGYLRLTQASGPNGDTSSTVYDSYSRPTSTTSATGAVTSYTYAAASPWTVVATTNGRWTRKTLDGFGRTVKAEAGSGRVTSTPVSVSETVYEACGCSAIGKTQKVSMPHASGATANWTTYAYDALGRTLSVTTPDNSSKQYVYLANIIRCR
jgi:YD repeat-containing protein